MELEYFEDDNAFQDMLTTEDDLIDAYASGELAGEEQQRFRNGSVNGAGGRARVRFARAFAGAVSAPRSVETKFRVIWPDNFKIIQSPRLLRTATIAAVIVFVAVFAWLVIDRRKLTNELRELRAQSAELRKQTEASQQTTDAERTRTTEIAAPLTGLRAQPGKPSNGPIHGRKVATRLGLPRAITPESHIAAVSESVAVTSPAEAAVNTSDATLGNSFEPQRITELPLNANNVVSLLTLQPGVSRGTDFVNGGRTDQLNITLEGVDAAIHIPSSMNWIRFQIILETAAIHEDYRIIIKSADGRFVTFVDWTEPLTPNHAIIDTPAISTSDLPSGDYVLLLMGKLSDGSLVKVTECSFKVIKY